MSVTGIRFIIIEMGANDLSHSLVEQRKAMEIYKGAISQLRQRIGPDCHVFLTYVVRS